MAFGPFQMEQMLLHMGNNCSRLREVKLFNCSVRSETLVRLGEMCPNISSLSLIWLDFNCFSFLGTGHGLVVVVGDMWITSGNAHLNYEGGRISIAK